MKHGISRHQTAVHRSGLSRPIRLAIEADLINTDITVFDYGCGHGDDIRRLKKRGIQSFGWDPVYRPKGTRREADVVNLGYVVNVIEEPEERAQTLLTAWEFAQRVLIVAARLNVEAKGNNHRNYNDGCLTQWNTFQKFYSQRELRDWIDDTLGVSSVAAGPGVFFVFRDENLRQSFAASRYRRMVSVPEQCQSDLLFEQHNNLLQPLMDFVVSHGRVPGDTELKEVTSLREVFGSVKRAFAVVRRATGKEQWEKIREERAQDLLVYLALEQFGGRPRFSELSGDIQLDVKAFWGTYTRACKAADELLFSAGDIETVNVSCKEASCGKLTREALYIHTIGLLHLPPILRVYEGCARAYIGNVEGANIVKLNRRTPKISYLSYPDFERNPHPALFGSLVVSLQPLDVRYRDYSESDNPPILHRKETFVPMDYPTRRKFERLTRQEERWGLYEKPSLIGTRNKWQELLDEKGLRLAGHRLVRN